MQRARRRLRAQGVACSRTSRLAGATEVDYLNGGIARFGRELGVPTPLNDTITALIKGVETSWHS